MPMAPLLSLLLLAAAPQALVERALFEAAPAGVRLELGAMHLRTVPEGCTLTHADATGAGLRSGVVNVRLSGARAGGQGCVAWASVEVRLFVPARFLLRAVAAGAPLRDAFETREVRVREGETALTGLPDDAVAVVPLAAGTRLQPHHVGKAGPVPGADIPVRLRSGAVEVTAVARAEKCAGGVACARLPGGKRVQGQWTGGALLVEVNR